MYMRSSIVLGLLAAAIAPTSAAGAVRTHATTRTLDGYRGLGTWVDLYDAAQRSDVAETVATATLHGVHTLYLETSNSGAAADVQDPAAVSAFIDAAHLQRLRIVAWYLPSLVDPATDRRRALAALRFRSAGGQGFDSVALDIEASDVRPTGGRTNRILALAGALRRAAGRRYPLGAIIPSPSGMAARPTYWPAFPYRGLARNLDVFLPMTYFTYHVHGTSRVHDDVDADIETIRSATHSAAVPIHVIGGVASKATSADVRGMVRAVRERGVLGAGLYDLATTTPRAWAELAAVPVNPLQRPPLPIPVASADVARDGVGNFAGDRSHPQEVYFESGPQTGEQRLRFQVLDVQRGELTVMVNWHTIAAVSPSRPQHWSRRRSLTIPAAALHARAANRIGFVAAGRYPHWSRWAVRSVSLRPPA